MLRLIFRHPKAVEGMMIFLCSSCWAGGGGKNCTGKMVYLDQLEVRNDVDFTNKFNLKRIVQDIKSLPLDKHQTWNFQSKPGNS